MLHNKIWQILEDCLQLKISRFFFHEPQFYKVSQI